MSNKDDRKKVLGRGLGALLQSPETDITAKDISGNFVVGAIANIPVSYIEENPFQPREYFDESELQALSQSIKEQGIIQPITTRKVGVDKYQIISGERRFRASKLAGLTEIPSYIRIANDQQMLEMALVENIQRHDLNSIEVAIAYQRLIEECKITQEALSKTVGKDRTTISNYLRLLKLPAEIQVALRDGLLTMGHARAIISIENEEQQLAMFNEIVNNKISVRGAEELVRNANTQTPKTSNKVTAKTTNEYDGLQNNLRNRLGTKIVLKVNPKGKGTIVIPFSSEEELQRLTSLLNQ